VLREAGAGDMLRQSGVLLMKYLPFIAIVVLCVATACSIKNEGPAPEREDTGFGAIPPNSWVTDPRNKPAW
jgi:hypothetical protein